MLLLLASPLLYAQSAPKRLSDWLLEQSLTPDAYPLGLSWRVPEEVPSQSELRFELLKILSGLDREVTADPDALGRLRDWVRTLPVTGRVPLAVPDARWLQANPTRDPVLQPGHTVVLPKRPRTVTVITERGERCSVVHFPGHEAMAYLEACSPASARRADWTWMAQPDGRIQRFGVATWNREVQDEPAPGAWIWAPSRGSGWPERLSQRLITFLATQGPAPDSTEGFPRCNANASPNAEQGPGASRQGGASQGFRLSGAGASSKGLTDQGCEGSPSGTGRSAVVAPLSGGLPARSRGPEVTASDWGSVGLMQTPTARMQSAGHLTVNFTHTRPYTQGNVFFQPFDWLEAGFRYTDIGNRAYGPPELSGSQSAKDKSFDAKFRLWSESAYVPQIALGLRDLTGTGLFAGEYVVGSKRSGPFDWSLGLGWGYVGRRGNLRNPLGSIGNRFDTRTTNVGQGGNLSFGSYFRGPTALFGGVQYQTPWERLILKLEYDGNSYQHEPLSNNQRQSSPWNLGLVYRAGRAVDFSFGIERGNTVMLGLTLHTQLDGLAMPKLHDPPRVAVTTTRPQQSPDWAATSRDIASQTDWYVQKIEQRGRELRVTIDEAEAVYWRERVDRTAAVLHRDAPEAVDRFTLTYRQRGLDVAEHVIDREAWVAQQTRPLPPSEQRETVIARAAEPTTSQTPLYENTRPKFESGFGVNFAQTLGGPDAFVLYQIYAEEQAKLRLRDDTWLQGTLRLRLIDNYDKFKYTAPSNLPRVRTFLREYVTTSRITLPNLQLTHVGRLTENQSYSAYAGYLEEMFAGVGGEWLYRPFASRVALGVDANVVQQRGFRQDFAFRDYRTSTGHATLYWDTGWQGVLATLSAGRYLAGDKGVTVDMSRAFKNGVTVGAFFTKTQVSAAQFGEGSFDKGLYLSIPFDAFLTRSSNTNAHFVYKPLTRDGGAKLARSVTLYDVTTARDDRTLQYQIAPPPNDAVIPSDRREAWSPPPTGPEPYTRITPKPAAAQWAADTPDEQRLVEALYRQQFRNIQVFYDSSHRLTVALSNDRIRPLSRAVGRAARTALRLAPLETREIRITLAERIDPVVTYDFFDLARLERYFSGAISQAELADYVAIEYVNPSARQKDPLARLDDMETATEDSSVAALLPDSRPLGRVASDVADAARIAKDANWLRVGVVGAGLVLASSALDKSADRFALNHGDSRWLKAGTNVGNAIPWLALAGSAVAAFDGSDPARSRTGYAAMEAGGTALLVATGLKYAVGRARPAENVGDHSFKPFSAASGYDSFPSGHTIVAWAVVTPFAKEYSAPWLYGVAAVSNFARVGGRQHWFSDTVAGGLLGYGIGNIFWESSRAPGKNAPRVLLDRSGIKLSWEYY